MGKNKGIKKYIIISKFSTIDNNRGSQALSYGSLEFCYKKGYLKPGQDIISFQFVKKFWKQECQDVTKCYVAGGLEWKHHTVNVFILQKILYDYTGLTLPFSKFRKYLQNVELVAAINGGDGFSDIYNTKLFLGRLNEIKIAIKEKLPLIFLPQTIGPFSIESNCKIAKDILRYASRIYVRDDRYVSELKEFGVNYIRENDLSAFMNPEPIDIDIAPNSIGINVSGLAYSNTYKSLSGQFDCYPELIDILINRFVGMGKRVYLIPHSYNYSSPEPSNDDMVACRLAFEKLKDKCNVFVVDRDLTSPQVKYVISKMSFFIGTRMHANFAAIFTKVPLFGLAYSYKFEGAFKTNGLDYEKQVSMINNIKKDEIIPIIDKIVEFYNQSKKE